MHKVLCRWLPLAFCAIVAWSASPGRAADAPRPAAGRNTVVWISMDGFRSDYLDRGPLPFFTRLTREALYSRRFHPVYPPITFPSHCAEATGVSVAHHGITGNDFYDAATHEKYHFPADASLLEAEPIWLTAARQSARTLVFDWPLSQNETGAVHADYFSAKFDKATDAERLDHLLDVWRQDGEGKGSGPGGGLRLLMGYVEATDPAGHKFGPDAPEVTAQLRTLDGDIGAFADKAVACWKQHAAPADHLYLLLTTDHGMSKVNYDVNLLKMLGLTYGQTEITLETVGDLGNVFLDQIPAGPAREARIADFLEKLKAYPFARAYRRENLPPAWDYANATRTGDLVVVLAQGYTYNKGATAAVVDAAQIKDGPKGMHGYPVEDDPEMYGIMFLARYPQPFGGKDLGEVDWDQYHPTVAKLLGIKPADGAKGKPLALPGE